jgi:putative ABC transport system substrate-binding protein
MRKDRDRATNRGRFGLRISKRFRIIVFILVSNAVSICGFSATERIAEAQPSKRLYRIGVLQRSTLPASFLEALKRGLRDHGYVEGQNIVIEKLATEGGISAMSSAELVRLGVDVIVATGTGAVLDANKATQSIPIVMSPSADAVAGGLVASLSHPGGNVTGLTMISPDLAGKRLELLKEVRPAILRIAAIFPLGGRSTAIEPWLKETEEGAKALGLRFQKVGLREDTSTWDAAIKAIAKEPKIALVVIENARLISQRALIAGFAVRHRLPAMFSVREHVEAGGLLSYGVDLVDVHYRAATYVDKILKGAKPADLPVEQPTKFELVINLKTARQIGVTIPPNVLARADRVIK